MTTTKRKVSMRDFLKIKAFIATGSFDEDFSSLDDEFLETVSYMNIYMPKGKEQAILDFIDKNKRERKLADIMAYAEFQQFKAMKNKQNQQKKQEQQDALTPADMMFAPPQPPVLPQGEQTIEELDKEMEF